MPPAPGDDTTSARRAPRVGRGPCVALAALALAVVACVMAQPCPCGEQFDRDPFDEEADFFVESGHDYSAHCFCRCGDGPEEAMPPSRTCAAYEGPCERLDGATDRLECR